MNVHTPERQPSETRQQYQARRAESKAIAKRATRGFNLDSTQRINPARAAKRGAK